MLLSVVFRDIRLQHYNQYEKHQEHVNNQSESDGYIHQLV